MRRLLMTMVLLMLIPAPAASAHPRGRVGPTNAEMDIAPWDGPRYRQLRSCESSNGRDSRNGRYHGYYQATLSTWSNAGGSGDPHFWTLHEQTARMRWWWHHSNPPGQWPTCWRAASRLADRD